MTDPFDALRPLLPLNSEGIELQHGPWRWHLADVDSTDDYNKEARRTAALEHCANCHDMLVDAIRGLLDTGSNVEDTPSRCFARAALAKAFGSTDKMPAHATDD